MTGYTVQPDLFSILTRFRFHRVGVSADIAKMYQQVALDPEDRDNHRILWRNSPQEPLQHLRMTRVTYGIASSAFQSTRCLTEVAQLCGVTVCSQAIRRDFYVYDFVSGADDVVSAERLVKGVVEELGKHGFPLRKWTSSNPSLVLSLPPELRETSDEATIWNQNPQNLLEAELGRISSHNQPANPT